MGAGRQARTPRRSASIPDRAYDAAALRRDPGPARRADQARSLLTRRIEHLSATGSTTIERKRLLKLEARMAVAEGDGRRGGRRARGDRRARSAGRRGADAARPALRARSATSSGPSSTTSGRRASRTSRPTPRSATPSCWSAQARLRRGGAAAQAAQEIDSPARDVHRYLEQVERVARSSN